MVACSVPTVCQDSSAEDFGDNWTLVSTTPSARTPSGTRGHLSDRPDEQRRADEQRARQRHFRDDQALVGAPAAARTAALARPQVGADVLPHQDQSRHQAEADRHQRHEAEGQRQHATADRRLRQARHLDRRDGDDRRQRDQGDEEPRGRAEDRQDQALGQELRHDLARRGAERRPDRDLARARRAPASAAATPRSGSR